MNSTYSTFVSSHLDNTKMNKFVSRYTSTMGGKATDFQEFFRNLIFLQKLNYSFVVETDYNTIKFMLDDSTRKLMCDTFNNLRIIHVVNIRNDSGAFGAPAPNAFGAPAPNAFGFGAVSQKPSDGYLICSKSAGFFGMPHSVVEFSTYDMSTQSYTQLNQITFDSMKEHNYSFTFSDYHFEKPVKQHTEKRRRVVNQE